MKTNRISFVGVKPREYYGQICYKCTGYGRRQHLDSASPGAADDRPESPDNAVRDEVARYLKEKLVSQRLDPLIYWKRNHKAYPNLSKLVRVYLSPPPS